MSIIQCKIINLIGKPWYWKSFLSLFFAIHYKNTHRIYSNVDFFYEGVKFNKTIKTIKDTSKITFDEFKDKPWLVIIDEWWSNVNARRSMSEENIEIVTELGMLARKKNVNVIYCSQLDRMLDVYLREMSFMTIELNRPFFENWKLVFNAEIKKNTFLVWYREFRLFELLDMWYSFNTLETSQIRKKTIKKEHKKTMKESESFWIVV